LSSFYKQLIMLAVVDALMNDADCLDESKNKSGIYGHLGVGPAFTADEAVTKYLKVFEGLEVPLPHVIEGEAEEEATMELGGTTEVGVLVMQAMRARGEGASYDGMLGPDEWNPVWPDGEPLATAIRQRTTVIP
jgi:hypothetical protein